VSERISQGELRNDSGRIMRALDEGRTFVVSRNGRSVGELRPPRRDRCGAVGMFRGAPGVACASMDIDEVVDQNINPRG
jgi:hypothetical protein